MSSPRPRVQREQRITINREFESVDEFVREYVSNISRSGVFIRSKAPLAVGTRVNLKFTVIMEDIETIEGLGQVVRLSESPRGMGVVFTKVTDHGRDLIVKLLTRRPPSGKVQAASGAVGTAEVTPSSRMTDIAVSTHSPQRAPGLRNTMPGRAVESAKKTIAGMPAADVSARPAPKRARAATPPTVTTARTEKK